MRTRSVGSSGASGATVRGLGSRDGYSVSIISPLRGTVCLHLLLGNRTHLSPARTWNMNIFASMSLTHARPRPATYGCQGLVALLELQRWCQRRPLTGQQMSGRAEDWISATTPISSLHRLSLGTEMPFALSPARRIREVLAGTLCTHHLAL